MPFKDKEYEKVWRKQWELKNRDRRRNCNRVNNNKRKLNVLKILGDRCICCGVTEWWNLTIDHIIPIGKERIETLTLYTMIVNGKVELSQFQVLCHGCNISKGKYKKCKLSHTECNPSGY